MTTKVVLWQKGKLTMSKDVLGGTALAEVAGPLKDFMEKIGGPEGTKWFMAFKRFLRKENPWKYVIDLDADPFVPNGWEVEEHIRGGQFEWNPAKVALYLSKGQQNGKVILGDQLRKELNDKQVYNANLLDYLFSHPDLIPEEWKSGYVFFWGTIYRDSDGYFCVRCLNWYDGRWLWHFYRLGYGFSHIYPAAVRASS